MSMNRDELIALIQELTPLPGLDSDAIAGSHDLLTGGVIDSMGLMTVVERIERALGRRVPPADITIDNFNSLAAMEQLQARLAA
ncbi:MAG: phosphopantetheine-binding protein [Bacteroidales bacterium]